MSGPKPPPYIPLTLDLGGAPLETAPTPAPAAAPTPAPPTAATRGGHDPQLDRSVDELELSVRTANCLQEANIRYIGELVQWTELDLLEIKNFGRKSLVEIRLILEEMGLAIETDVAGWTPPA